jgi:Carboxypeptidase regulatory-like domain/TonB-dependent Receptor Plug Domain
MPFKTMALSARTTMIKSLSLVVLGIAFRAFAQFSAATVIGAVQDSSKAAITDAKLKLINTQTGTENDSTTNREGGFLLPGIIPGVYTLQIERDGFATTQVNGMTLNGGDTKNLLIRMKVGAVTETVSVDASGLTMNETDASVNTVVDRQFISASPLNGRTLQDLLSVTPGIVTQNPQTATQSGSQTQGDFSVNGQPTNSNSFFVDGVAANVNSGLSPGGSRSSATGSISGLTALGTTHSLVSVDALQEFRVLSSTYSAEYGRTPGGQFNFVTRSGGNGVHGGFYEYFRSNLLDTADWFATSQRYPISPANYNQNDAGATLGAPIVLPGIYNGRDKSFIFLSYEGLYVDQQTPQAFFYTPYFCTPDNDVCNAPPVVSSAMEQVLATFPSPNLASNLNLGFLPYQTGLALAPVGGVSFPSHVNSSSVRIDHTFSPRFSAFLRYGDTPSNGQASQLYSVTTYRTGNQTFTYGATNQLSTTRNNEFRLGYATGDVRANTITKTLFDDGGGLSYIGPAGNLNAALGVPKSVAYAGADAYIHLTGIGDSDSSTNHLSSSLHQWNVRDTFSLRAQNHLVKIGIDQRRVAVNLTPATLSVLADFFTRDSILTNAASDLVVARSLPANPTLEEFSAFAEDEWKVSPTLNLSLGLRWDVNPAPRGQHGQDAYTVLGDVKQPATLQLAPRGTPLWHTSWYALAPRFGVAWVARNEPGKELIVRTGGGVFFDTGTQPALKAFQGIGFTTYAHFLDAPVPATPAQIDFSNTVAPPYGNMEAFAFAPHRQLPYSWQWNLGVEQALGKNQSITVSYVGASGRRLLEEQRTNVGLLNPDFGNVSYFPSGVTSNFQSLQTKFQRTLPRGLEALASYTWAHSSDYGSTDPFFPLKYGNSDLDVRQNLEAAAFWSSPVGHRFRSRRRLSEGWNLDGRLIARTGFPVDLLGNFFFDPVTGRPYYSGVNLTANRSLYSHGSQYPGGRIFNGGVNATNPAFSLPDGGEQGDAPRNLVRGFGTVQGNFAVRQTIHLYDQLNLQLRVEIFNVFNHPSFGYIDPSLSDELFGQSTKSLDQSFGTTGALYNQGGPRVVQLSIRMTF